jgi:leader peptidase (prepilin peptidase) / N-methyltransferase
MELLVFCLLFFFGAAVGSFLGVVVDRMKSREPVWKGRSHCDHCRHNLRPLDLIPIFSFFFLGRKCRYCHKGLTWFYPTIEIVTGLTYIAVGIVLWQSGTLLLSLSYQLLALYYLILMSALLVIFFTDFRYGIIPFSVVGFALVLTLLWDLLFPFLQMSPAVIHLFNLQTNVFVLLGSALGAGGFFLLIFALTKGRGMGFGDVVYAFLMGFLLGFPGVVLGLYLSFVLGAVIALLLVALKKKQFKGGTIPFGPFLVLGTIIGLLWGNVLIAYFLQLLM